MAVEQLIVDHHVLAGVAFTGNVLGTLGSLYLTDELLHKRYRILEGLTAFLTFGIPLGIGFGIVGGIIPAILAGGLNGAWMALRVMDVLPGGYSFTGVIQWAFAYGIVTTLTHSLTLGLSAAFASLIAGSARYLIAQRGNKALASQVLRNRRQTWVGLSLIAITGVLMMGAATLLQGEHLFVDNLHSSDLVIIAVSAGIGWFGSAGPSIVRWAKALPIGGLGAIGLVCILLGFVAQALTSVPSMLDIPVR